MSNLLFHSPFSSVIWIVVFWSLMISTSVPILQPFPRFIIRSSCCKMLGCLSYITTRFFLTAHWFNFFSQKMFTYCLHDYIMCMIFFNFIYSIKMDWDLMCQLMIFITFQKNIYPRMKQSALSINQYIYVEVRNAKSIQSFWNSFKLLIWFNVPS